VYTISKLIFGFDIDGVLTGDDDGVTNLWLQKAAEYFGQEMIRPSFYIEEAFDRTVEEVREFFAAKIDSIFASVPIRPHCAETLTKLWDQGCTIHLITARDEEHRQVTEAWLKKHEIPYHTLSMSPHKQSYSKGDRCVELGVDFFVDDKFENAHEVAERGIYTLLFHASHNRDRETTLPRVRSWLDINEHIDYLIQDTLSASSR